MSPEYERLAGLRDDIERRLVIAKQTAALCEQQREDVHRAIGALIGAPTEDR
jgi:hypothetical protein